MQEGKKEGYKIMAAKSYKMNSACFVKLNVYGEAEQCKGEQRLVSNSNGTEERAAASTTSVPSPNLKLVPEPDWMGAQGEAEGGLHPAVPYLLEGADHREVPLQGQGDGQVHTGCQAGLEHGR